MNVLGVLNPLVASRFAIGPVHDDEVRLELADQLAQLVAAVPVRAEVLVLVLNSLRVDPLEQRGLRCVRLVLRNLVLQNQRPRQTRDQLQITVDDVLRTMLTSLTPSAMRNLSAWFVFPATPPATSGSC